MHEIIEAELGVLKSAARLAEAIHKEHAENDSGFTESELERCDEFLIIASDAESACSTFRRLLIYHHSKGHPLDYASLLNALINAYQVLHEKLFPFAQSLKDERRRQGHRSPYFERFEMSKHNLEKRLTEHQNGEDELEESIFREKANEISLSNARLKQIAEKHPAPQDWYDE